MEVKASYKIIEVDVSRHYHCIVESQLIPENQELNFNGQHEEGNTNEDVTRNSTVNKVPQGLKNVFPNMKILWIMSSKLKKINKDDLKEYKNLTELRCSVNELEYLPGDLFDDFKDLKWIAFNDNNLRVVEPNILDKLDNLIYVDFRNNPQYGNIQNGCKKLKKSQQNLIKDNQQLQNTKLRLETELEQEKLKNIKLVSQLQSGFFTDFRNFIDDDTTKDFLVQIEDHDFPVHKFLLVARSPTLAEIFKTNPEVENLNLVDISVETFGIILKFLYTDELPGDDATNILHLFAAAGQLKIEELKDFAAMKMINQINEDNATEVLNLSNKYENQMLRKKAFDVIRDKHLDIRFNPDWAANVEKMTKVLNYIKKREEMMRALQAEFEELARN
ncbi:unnamed protein product [Chironomus riparius]|uniref:BTB domain-containing protein n=1 Tax=Chironomus riparius TaxID=315576 RepID=A0A9N9S7R8_9DIPT|nr:unnamed protein product [Chironomus riparius]